MIDVNPTNAEFPRLFQRPDAVFAKNSLGQIQAVGVGEIFKKSNFIRKFGFGESRFAIDRIDVVKNIMDFQIIGKVANNIFAAIRKNGWN